MDTAGLGYGGRILWFRLWFGIRRTGIQWTRIGGTAGMAIPRAIPTLPYGGYWPSYGGVTTYPRSYYNSATIIHRMSPAIIELDMANWLRANWLRANRLRANRLRANRRGYGQTGYGLFTTCNGWE